MQAQKIGIYEIPLAGIDGERKVYIGCTKRNFSERIKEHKNDIEKQ